jgi:hypothetical protein
MFALMLTPAVFSLLVLAAHFLRRGNLLLCGAALAVLGMLLFTRVRWAPRAAQIALGAATLLWAQTLLELMEQRQVAGEPVGRLVVILGSVIGLNVVAVLLLGTARVTRRFVSASATEPTAN